MLFILEPLNHSIEKQSELRRWYFDNGLVYSELTGTALVDSVAQTVMVNKKVPMAGQEGLDFPEFVADANGEPVTVEQVVRLTVRPLRWMLTMTGAWNLDQVSTATFATAPH